VGHNFKSVLENIRCPRRILALRCPKIEEVGADLPAERMSEW
jgi:hypothetical protein